LALFDMGRGAVGSAGAIRMNRSSTYRRASSRTLRSWMAAFGGIRARAGAVGGAKNYCNQGDVRGRPDPLPWGLELGAAAERHSVTSVQRRSRSSPVPVTKSARLSRQSPAISGAVVEHRRGTPQTDRRAGLRFVDLTPSPVSYRNSAASDPAARGDSRGDEIESVGVDQAVSCAACGGSCGSAVTGGPSNGTSR